VINYFAYCIPVVFLAVILGARLNRKIAVDKFHKYIYLILIILGITLVINAVSKLM